MNAILKENENQIVEFDEFETQLIQLEKDYGTRVYDLTDEKEEAAAHSDRLKVAKTQTAFKKTRLAVKEVAQAVVNSVNQKSKIIDDRMEVVKQNIKGQLDKRDQELQKRAEKLQCMINEILEHGEFERFNGPDSVILNNRLESIRCYVVDDKYEDRKADATLALVEITRQLETMLDDTLKSEKEAADLKQLRKEKEERERADREEKIRKEAAEKATREAETAAQDAIDEAEKREHFAESKRLSEKKNAEHAAKRAEEEKKRAEETAIIAEREKIKLEQAQKEAKEKVLLEKEEAKKSKQGHRKKIHKEAKTAFIDNNFNSNDATKIIELITDGKIKNVTINY